MPGYLDGLDESAIPNMAEGEEEGEEEAEQGGGGGEPGPAASPSPAPAPAPAPTLAGTAYDHRATDDGEERLGTPEDDQWKQISSVPMAALVQLIFEVRRRLGSGGGWGARPEAVQARTLVCGAAARAWRGARMCGDVPLPLPCCADSAVR